MKNTHGGVLLLVKLQALACKLKLTLVRGCFSCFLNCADDTKSRKASHFFVHQCASLQNVLTNCTLYLYVILNRVPLLYLAWNFFSTFMSSIGGGPSIKNGYVKFIWNVSNMGYIRSILTAVCRLWTYHNSGTRHKVCHNIKNTFYKWRSF